LAETHKTEIITPLCHSFIHSFHWHVQKG
jgi:hypothetical protein